jgi:hypothetical protein
VWLALHSSVFNHFEPINLLTPHGTEIVQLNTRLVGSKITDFSPSQKTELTDYKAGISFVYSAPIATVPIASYLVVSTYSRHFSHLADVVRHGMRNEKSDRAQEVEADGDCRLPKLEVRAEEEGYERTKLSTVNSQLNWTEWSSVGSSLLDSSIPQLILLAIFAGEREDSIPRWRNRFRLARVFFWDFEPFIQETGFLTALLVHFIFDYDYNDLSAFCRLPLSDSFFRFWESESSPKTRFRFDSEHERELAYSWIDPTLEWRQLASAVWQLGLPAFQNGIRPNGSAH